MESVVLDVARSAIAYVLGPLLGAAVGWFAANRRAKRRKAAVLRDLAGLPAEAKAVLVHFYEQGAHTMRGNPGAPPVRLLIHLGVVKVGPGAGGYDAVNRYLSLTREVWEVMDDWALSEGVISWDEPMQESP